MKTYTRRTALTIASSLLLASLPTKSFGFAHNKLLGGSSGVGGAIMGVTGALVSDPLFDNKSLGEVYVATSRLIHVTTNEIGKGVVSAVIALEIKEEKDLPAYLSDLEAVEMPNSFTGQIKERDAEIIKFSTEASVEIVEKLKSGFSLSDEAKKELAKAYTSVGISQTYSNKSLKGGANFAIAVTKESDLLSVAGKLKDVLKLDLDVQAFLSALTSFGGDVTDLLGNVSGIFDLKDAIKDAEDMSGVELAKAEFLEESANKTIDETVANDLEKFAT